MTEDELQEKVAALCDELGLYCYHSPDSRRSPSGWPDCVILNWETGKMIFRELKTGSGELSRQQKRISYAMRAGRHDFAVWRPSDLASGRIWETLIWLTGQTPSWAAR